MRRGRLAVVACWLVLVGCADIRPNLPDGEDDDDSEPIADDDDDGDIGSDDADGPDGGVAGGPDGGVPDPDAAPPEEQTRTFGAENFTDTYIRANNPTFNYGASPRVCADAPTDDRRILMRVDVSSLAAGVAVTGAELHIWVGTAVNDYSTELYTVYPMLEEWKEGVQDAAAGNASWDVRLPATPWSATGAGVGSRGASAVGSFVPAGIDTEYAIELDADMVQGWVDDPASNFGIVILSAGTDGGCFDSSEFATASKRPSLVVTYD